MVLLNRELLTNLQRRSAAAVTPIALWSDDVQRFRWRTREDVLKTYPGTKFVAGSMATFLFETAKCSVTTQIAFNSEIVIVLAAQEM
jgi:mRNA-degrading endonuclease HigB of HigAB toxin-antitoxin module